MSELPRLAVVGAGVLGAGVAHALAASGRDVLLVDRDAAALERTRAGIRAGARLARLQRSSAASVLASVTLTTEKAGLAAAAFVIENVTEDLEIKLAVHRELDAICAEERVFAADTSAISMARLAPATRRPERFVGVHFMNPVPTARWHEVVRGASTSARPAMRLVRSFARKRAG